MNGDPKPWTEDSILAYYKFTNAFRELDRGTIALHRLIQVDVLRNLPLDSLPRTEWELVIATVWWYRLFNWEDHAFEFEGGDLPPYDVLAKYIRDRADRGEKIFTGAHMTTGNPGEKKYETYLEAAAQAFRYAPLVYDVCVQLNSMEKTYDELLNYYRVGKFISYEIVCDLSHLPVLQEAKDRLTWGNVGPGAKRGMERLGLDPTIATMRALWEYAPEYLEDHVRRHHLMMRSKDSERPNTEWPPFEIREIEHSLCEFDKYERARLGQGSPKGVFVPNEEGLLPNV